MANIFLVSDTHFGHAGVCRFTHEDTGIKIRPWTDPNEMDEDMVRMWNEIVAPNDRVYHLGDVVINRRCLPTLNRLNGKKVLIDRKSTRLNSSHIPLSRMPSSA